MIEFKPLPERPAPVETVGPLAWLRDNFFSSILSSTITVFIISMLLYILPGLFDWLFFSAYWSGTTEADCGKDGACWVFVKSWLQQFIYSNYGAQEWSQNTEIWRVNLVLFLLLAIIIVPNVLSKKIRNKVSILLFLLYPFIGIAILDGRLLGLPYVSTDDWGGFSLNVFLAAISIIIAFPLSFLWALGRRSNMPFARSICIIFIEFFRGVPVLALFFMGSVMLPLFFPEGTNPDKLLRVWIVLTLFMSGYMAEVFRGGFQAIPHGQYEAADSLGLSYWQKTLLIIFPQVIKISMPNILATFVMLFKNTTFLLIIAIPEILNTVQTALENSNWLEGHAPEGYIFVGLVFWICCFGMSLLSASIERKLDTSHKH